MKNYFTLVKTLLRSALRKKSGDNKINVGMLVGYILLGIVYLAIIVGVCIFIGFSSSMLVQYEAVSAVAFLILLIATALTLILGTITTLNFIYFGKDAQFLSALPVKPGAVFAAKFTVVYLYEFATSALVILFPMLILGITTGAGILFYLAMLFALVLVPLLPMILASILAIPLLYLSTYFKHRGAASSIMMILAFAAVMGVYFYGIMTIQNGVIGDDPTDLEAILIGFRDGLLSTSYYFLPVYAIVAFGCSAPIFGLSGAAASGVGFVTMIGLAAVLTVLTVMLANAMYQRSISLQQENRKTAGAKGEYVNQSALKSLIKKEWKYLIRIPSFGMQCLLGIVMAPLFVVIFRFIGSTGSVEGETAAAMRYIPYLTTWLMILIFGGGMSVTACTAISREGSGIATLKSLPVSYKTIVSAKLRVALTISYASAALGLVLSLILQTPIWQMAPFAVFLIFYAYAVNAFSLKSDIKHPKLDWTTPVEAVKRNKNTTIPTLAAMGVSVLGGSLLLSGTFFLPWVYGLVVWLAAIVLAGAMAFLAHRRLYADLDRHFAAMN